MENTKIIFKSQLRDGNHLEEYERQCDGILIKDDKISNLRFYLEDDYYIINMSHDQIRIHKRGKEAVDMSFKQDSYTLEYHLNEKMMVQGKMKEYYLDENKMILIYCLSDDESIINRIEVDYKGVE